MPAKPLALALTLLLISGSAAFAHTLDAEIVAAAKNWLVVMGDKGKKANLAFRDEERFDWRYIPSSRDGAVIRGMSAAERAATKQLLRSTLSSGGILKAEAIMALEQVLREIEGGSASFRDPENYFISIFGEPGAFPWGWRLEGHHLSINVTLSASGAISVTPAFAGTNPAKIPSGPRAGFRIQNDEYVLSLRLANGLTPAQRKLAMIADRSLGEIVTGPGRGDALSKPQGIPVPDLSPRQRILLMELITAYVGLARDEIGQPYMSLVEKGLADTRFAWAGPTSGGEPFYYRIHGPRILIEFDDTQNGGNHIHSLWRDPMNDFGRDDLARHYKGAPAQHGHVHKRY
ncbi:MAG: DUF3500 domain-containing protein [Proteobacteria bacterium]|nr:DUF3500 domain-containing protein [Pseudomonadota bacterium]